MERTRPFARYPDPGQQHSLSDSGTDHWRHQLIGFTNIRLCVDTSCFSAPDLNYGVGGVARIMLAPRMGVHAGFRYARHYELAFTVGAAFRLWD